MQFKRQCNNIFKVLKEKKKTVNLGAICNKASMKNKDEIFIFSDKQKLSRF